MKQIHFRLRYNAKVLSPQNDHGNPIGMIGRLTAPEVNMAVFFRAITYAVLFIGLVLVYLPASILSWSGLDRPAAMEVQQFLGLGIGTTGALLVLWCILTFVTVGRGTPAPFDPPRRLVIRGPYGFVRNPMYIGAGLALAGAALFYESLPLLGYTGLFFLVSHLFVLLYEEPTLQRTYGGEYTAYCRRVKRWRPSLTTSK
jgi:protein-S-isoprenylcysteine O-methyltransferase Ste14